LDFPSSNILWNATGGDSTSSVGSAMGQQQHVYFRPLEALSQYRQSTEIFG